MFFIFGVKNKMLFAEGERWIQRCIMEYPEEFEGRTITFESRLDAGEKVRRVDVVVKMEENSRPIYYEFKSVAKIPPQNFAEQFLKDLEVAKDLDQIKWYFDGKKLSKLDKEVFLKELEKVSIKKELIQKWVNNPRLQSKEDFINFVSDNFETIFKMK